MNGSGDPFSDAGDDGDFGGGGGNPLAALGALVASSPLAPLLAAASKRQRRWLDASTPHVGGRWGALAALSALYALRVWYVQGFYIVTYALGIYNLNLLLGFLTPQIDPELEGPTLPSQRSDEFRPFQRRLPEFKFWWASTRSVAASLAATAFPALDVPVFWPILLVYFCALFFVTMRRQVRHMIKHRYVPFSLGKARYKGGGGGGKKGGGK